MPSHFSSIIFIITLSIEVNHGHGHGQIFRETALMEMIVFQCLAQGQLYSFLCQSYRIMCILNSNNHIVQLTYVLPKYIFGLSWHYLIGQL